MKVEGFEVFYLERREEWLDWCPEDVPVFDLD
jgi:hypothetical protein